MTHASAMRVVLVLVALASAGTTAMIVLNVVRGSSRTVPAAWSNSALPQPLPGPTFTLTDSFGESFPSNQLQGKAWITTFIFTRCAGPCPRITARVKTLQDELSDWPRWDDIRLVSVSVDPWNDTPEALAAYAESFEADRAHWKFLKGEPDTLWPIVRDGFKLPVGHAPDDAVMPILHSQKFVLIDRQGRLRGFYDALEEQGKADLLNDLRLVLGEDADGL